MNRVQKRYLWDFILTMVVLTTGLSLLFSVVSVVDEADEIIRVARSSVLIIQIVLLRLPEFFGYLIPFTSMIGVFLVLAVANRRNELMVLQTSGADMRRFLIPFLIAGIVLSMLVFFFSEVVRPLASAEIKNLLTPEKDRFSYVSGELWLRPSREIIARAGAFDPYNGKLKEISLFWLEGGRLKKRIESARGRWIEDRWVLERSTVYDLTGRRVYNRESLILNKMGSPEEFLKIKEAVEEMSVFRLRQYLMRLDRFGIKNQKLWVDLYSRYSYPFTALALMFIGISLSLRMRQLGGVVSILLLVISLFGYWFLLTVSVSLGYAGTLPPPLSGCLLPLSVNLLGLYLYLKTLL